jgi:hypothetical protein
MVQTERLLYPMKIVTFRANQHNEPIDAFEYMIRNNLDAEVLSLNDDTFLNQKTKDKYLFTFDIGIGFGLRRANQLRSICKRNLIVELPCIRNLSDYYTLTWEGIKYYGDFKNRNSDNKRWLKIKNEKRLQKEIYDSLDIKPWKSPGDKIIVLTQKPVDRALDELYIYYTSYYDWLKRTIYDIQNLCDREVVLRIHPEHKPTERDQIKSIAKLFDNVSVSDSIDIKEDLKQAYCTVTFNSTAAIFSVFEGVPVIILGSGAEVKNVAHKCLTDLNNLDYTKDTNQWCNDIGYAVWSEQEIRSGEAWTHMMK